MTRTEFENRAVLYRILYDLEELITIKKRFIETLTPRMRSNDSAIQSKTVVQ